MWYRLLLILELPLLLLDCMGSLLVGESFQNTLSAKAWDARSQVHFYWTHSFIDAIFWPSHCEEQWVREQKYGSVWAAWLAQFKGS